MVKGRSGERGSIELGMYVNDRVLMVSDESITYFSVVFSLSSLPTGVAKFTVSSDLVREVTGDTDGILSMSAFGEDPNSAVNYAIHIETCDRQIVTSDTVSVTLNFVFGTKLLYANMDNTATEGTSLDVIKQLLAKNDLAYDDMLSANAIRPQDSQVWRLVEGSVYDHLGQLTERSLYPGDMMFWAIDESSGSIRLSSIRRARQDSEKHLIMYSQNAVAGTANAIVKFDSPRCTMWKYAVYAPANISGATVQARNPNLMVDSFTADGKKDMGIFRDGSWERMLAAFGVPNTYGEYGATYGPKDLIRPFPNNTHKSYAIAPSVRLALLATYEKAVTVTVYNTFGPNVGDMVKFAARKPTTNAGDIELDDYYTDEYLVVSKSVTKDPTVAVGLIGNTRNDTTCDVTSTCTMVSSNVLNDMNSDGYRGVTDLLKRISEVKA